MFSFGGLIEFDEFRTCGRLPVFRLHFGSGTECRCLQLAAHGTMAVQYILQLAIDFVLYLLAKLARAGLLDGKRATTHWRYTSSLQEQFPAIEVVPDVLYVDEGQIITSAGSAAGIDAGLHLIRRDFGTTIANQVARRLVVTPHRNGGQKQFIPAPIYTGTNKKFDATDCRRAAIVSASGL